MPESVIQAQGKLSPEEAEASILARRIAGVEVGLIHDRGPEVRVDSPECKAYSSPNSTSATGRTWSLRLSAEAMADKSPPASPEGSLTV